MDKILLNILGPFGWPKVENGMPSLPSIPGVYLMTVENQDGFLPYSVGITRRPMNIRFSEHTNSFVNGEYNILDLVAAQQGTRKVVWKGWGWTPEKRADYEARKDDIVDTVHRQLSGTRIFVIDIGTAPRILERLEAAIANHYYKQDNILFDQGMLLMPRWESEEPLKIIFQCDSKLQGFPFEIEI